MKKNALARKILCGLLAAGVVGACGSVMAADNVLVADKNNTTTSITQENYTSTSDNGKTIFSNGEKTTEQVYISTADNVESITITNSGSGDLYGVRASDDITSSSGVMPKGIGAKIDLGTSNTDKITINVKSDKWATGICAMKGGEISIKSKKLLVEVDGAVGEYSAAIWAQGNSNSSTNVMIDVDNIILNAKSDDNDAKALVAMSGAKIDINGNLKIDAPIALLTRGGSTTNINESGNNTVQLKGDIVFDYDANTSGTPIDANVNIKLAGSDSYWNGNTRVDWSGKNGHLPNSTELSVNSFELTLADGAQWNPNSVKKEGAYSDDGSAATMKGSQYTALNNLTLNNGVINLDSSKLTTDDALQIENIKGTGGTINTNSVDNTMIITQSKDIDTKLAVHGTSEVADQLNAGTIKAQDLADVVINADEKSLVSSGSTDAGTIGGAYTFEVDEQGDVVANSVRQAENATNRAISDMASISLMTWRQENNDMNKRLGELRDSKGEYGAWARMARGESKYGAQNVKNQYNYYQVGYDEKLSVNPNWTVGVALTRTEGNSTFATGSGENKHTGFAVYGSYLADNGSFIDLIAKYARMDNDYKTIGAGVGDADYETNGYSLSAEYGKRFTKDNGFWIEPQVELTYGKVGSASYTTSKGANVYQDGVDSLVGRLGFSLGKDIKQGNVYVRASYLYDFDGETTAYMSKAGAGATKFEQDLGGGWWEVGVGTNLNLSDATHLYFDVEKTYGGNVATPWQWNAGVRWSF